MENKGNGVPDTLKRYISDGTEQRICQRYAQLKADAECLDFGELDHNVVVLDTETTGLSFAHDELIQIAAARMECGQITDWYVTFVNPGKRIPDDIVHLTGICDADVADAPDPETAVAGLVDFVGDAFVVAHNVEFDKTMTTKHVAGYPLLERTWVDSLDLARIALPRLSSHRLIDLVRAFECPVSTHRADDDVASTCAVFRILLAAVWAMPVAVVGKIARLGDVSQWSTGRVFQIIFDARVKDMRKKACWEAGEDYDPSAETHVEAAFSLRALRKSCVAGKVRSEKKDAEALAMDPACGLSYPTIDEVNGAFGKQGLVGRLYPDYEARKEQQQMSQAVRGAFEASENLVVEAGTGVGKSMAYLVPAVLLAKKNDIAVGVATKTNALLDQLVYHELPALAQQIPDLTYAPLKGFSHYLCLRKVDKLVAEGAQFRQASGKEVYSAAALAALLGYIEQTPYDDMDGMKIDYRAVPRWSISTTSHECLRRKCPFFGQSCYVHGARRQAEMADVVVTNHSLLFCDLVADGGLLPPIRYWVVDEAHSAETEARKAFSLCLDGEEILRTSQHLASAEASRNPFLRVERRLVKADKPEAAVFLCGLTSKAQAQAKAFDSAAQLFVGHMKDLLYFDPNKRSKGYDTFELWVNKGVRDSQAFGALAGFGKTFADTAGELVTTCQNLVAYLEDFENASDLQREIASSALTLKEMVSAAEVILGPASDSYAYSATLCRKKDRVAEKLEALMVNMGTALEDTLYARTHSVVFTSATIAIDGKFNSFELAMGLNQGEGTKTREVCLQSSYNFDEQMTVYVATDMPEPYDPQYLKKLQELLSATHVAQRGSMLTLFTNRREMEQCFDAVNPVCKDAGLRVVCQKWGVSVKGLRDEFVQDKHLSLFALKSFWEGFDAPGDTLRGVIIPKLPFNKPTDPLYCERADRDDGAWRKYVLPAAIIETKQAAGRLIRKADDRGVLILADKRLVTKSYGKSFIRSLPSKNVVFATCADIAARLSDNARED